MIHSASSDADNARPDDERLSNTRAFVDRVNGSPACGILDVRKFERGSLFFEARVNLDCVIGQSKITLLNLLRLYI